MSTSTLTRENEIKNTLREDVLIEKIKFNINKSATIFYKTTNNNCTRQTMFVGKEPATQEFLNIYKSLLDGFIGCLPIFQKEVSSLKMDSIKFAYDNEGYLEKAQYIVSYTLHKNNKAMTITTPLLAIYKEGLENEFTISGTHETAIRRVIELAKAYMNGETRIQQTNLNLTIVR